MITIETVKQAEKIGQYNFGFIIESNTGIAIINNEVSFEVYCSNEDNWYSIENIKYSFDQMQSTWKCILIQRTFLQAAILVLNGKFAAINPALRSLNYNI